ncbi:MAG: hypothetical protein K1Y01_06970, partial [Vicinamibacteria bacterium]|nr:hypothetical protein [Vicinamibacteria bacterium]
QDVGRIAANLERGGYWRWKQPWIALDVEHQWTAACVGDRRVARDHTVNDGNRTHPAIRLRTFLMGLPMRVPRPAEAPEAEEWIGWVRTDDDEGGVPTTKGEESCAADHQ